MDAPKQEQPQSQAPSAALSEQEAKRLKEEELRQRRRARILANSTSRLSRITGLAAEPSALSTSTPPSSTSTSFGHSNFSGAQHAPASPSLRHSSPTVSHLRGEEERNKNNVEEERKGSAIPPTMPSNSAESTSSPTPVSLPSTRETTPPPVQTAGGLERGEAVDDKLRDRDNPESLLSASSPAVLDSTSTPKDAEKTRGEHPAHPSLSRSDNHLHAHQDGQQGQETAQPATSENPDGRAQLADSMFRSAPTVVLRPRRNPGMEQPRPSSDLASSTGSATSGASGTQTKVSAITKAVQNIKPYFLAICAIVLAILYHIAISSPQFSSLAGTLNTTNDAIDTSPGSDLLSWLISIARQAYTGDNQLSIPLLFLAVEFIFLLQPLAALFTSMKTYVTESVERMQRQRKPAVNPEIARLQARMRHIWPMDEDELAAGPFGFGQGSGPQGMDISDLLPLDKLGAGLDLFNVGLNTWLLGQMLFADFFFFVFCFVSSHALVDLCL